MTDTSTFRLTLDSESVGIEDIITAYENLRNLLTSVERVVVGDNRSSVHWQTAHDPVVEITASVNGANKEQLDKIVYLAADGLVTGSRSGHYPQVFRDEAIQAAQTILRLLQRTESLTVYADTYGEKQISEARVEETIVGLKMRRQVYSSIEGALRQLTASSRPGYTAAIKDRLSNADVKFTFGREQLEAIKGLFDKNVVAEGMIVFKADGVPQRFIGTPTIRERVRNMPLRSFVGALPAFTDGEMAEDFLERLNDDTTPT